MTNKYKTAENGMTYFCRYHLFWCTTYRRSILTDPIRNRVKELLQEICKMHGVTILAVDVQPNSVYLHADVPANIGMVQILRSLKYKTAKVRVKEFPELQRRSQSLWTRAAFVSTEQKKPAEAIEQWLSMQKTPAQAQAEQKQARRRWYETEKQKRSESEHGESEHGESGESEHGESTGLEKN